MCVYIYEIGDDNVVCFFNLPGLLKKCSWDDSSGDGEPGS